ncbi:unnamed protein product [Prunus brigantina]
MAHTPQQNGVVERKNMTVIEIAKSMLHEKGIPYFLWAEVVHTAVYILNMCPKKALNNIKPFEAYSGRKTGVAYLKIFSSLCYVHVPTELRHKLEPKSVKGVFVGYATCEKGYMIYDPISKKLTLSRDIIFDEKSSWTCEERNTQPYDHSPLKWRRLDDVLAQCNLCIIEPEKYAKAKPVIGVQWVYKTKLNLNGLVQKNKARLVAKGYAKKPGLDYNETYAPIARLDTIRTLIALTAQKEWKLYQLDVKVAFLNGVLVTPRTRGKELLDEFKKDMMMKYEMTYLGLLRHFLGMGVVQTSPSIFIHQKKYASSLLNKYIKGTLDYGLEYVKGKNSMLIGFCDSDWGGSIEDKLQTEATPLQCDNTFAIAITKNLVFHQKTKYID